jgi:hypothetical protein
VKLIAGWKWTLILGGVIWLTEPYLTTKTNAAIEGKKIRDQMHDFIGILDTRFEFRRPCLC